METSRTFQKVLNPTLKSRLDLGQHQEHVAQDFRTSQGPVVVVPGACPDVGEPVLLHAVDDQGSIRDEMFPGGLFPFSALVEVDVAHRLFEFRYRIAEGGVDPAREGGHRVISVTGMEPVAGAVHAVEAQLPVSVGIRVVGPHPLNELLHLFPYAPGVGDRRDDGVPAHIRPRHVVVNVPAFHQSRFQHEGVESLRLDEIFEQTGAKAIPFVQIVGVLGHTNDLCVAEYS